MTEIEDVGEARGDSLASGGGVVVTPVAPASEGAAAGVVEGDAAPGDGVAVAIVVGLAAMMPSGLGVALGDGFKVAVGEGASDACALGWALAAA